MTIHEEYEEKFGADGRFNETKLPAKLNEALMKEAIINEQPLTEEYVDSVAQAYFKAALSS